MKTLFILSLCLSTALFGALSQAYDYPLSLTDQEGREVVWEQQSVSPFDELVVSWNARRPPSGSYLFLVSLHRDGAWSPWLYYAEWGSPGQILFKEDPPGSFAEARFGKVKPHKGLSDGFRVKAIALDGARLSDVEKLFATSLRSGEKPPAYCDELLSSVFLDGVPRQAQITLRHGRYYDLSLPTAMSNALNYLAGKKAVDPLEFAEKVCDDDNQFYESWIFNTAEGYEKLQIETQLLYLPDFPSLHAYLTRGLPVVVGIKGMASGAPRPYYIEHAICVIGYDPEQKKVHCIDSAFPNDRSTLTAYPLDDFLRVWGNQRNVACVFGTMKK